MAAQGNLFDAPPIPGLSCLAELVAADEEQQLVDAIGQVELAPFRFQGWLGKRRTTSFGWAYDFDNARFEPTRAMPEWLLPLRERAARFADVPAEALPHALVTRYDPGAGIGWHRDRPVFGKVVGISLGAPATLRFRRRRASGFERRTLPLSSRSAYLLSGEARSEWEHSIAPIEATRWSITFRGLAQPA